MQTDDPGSAEQPTQTTCAACSAHLTPPNTIHTERHCDKCGETTYVVEPGQDGQGIRVRAGDRFVIPSGTIMFSLDRNKSSGWFSRSGLAWYVSVLLSAGAPETPDDIESLFDRYFEECQSILRRSEALKDLDLDTEAGVHAAAERVINTDHLRDSIEYWAIGEGAALADTVAALADGDTQRVAWAMNRLTNAHAMVVFKRNLEPVMD